MADMDLSAFTTEQLASGFEKAMAAGDVLNAGLIQQELEGRRGGGTVGDTSVTEQGLSGIYEGLASGFGAPADLASAGLRALGVDISEDPFGGSESIKRGLENIASLGGNIDAQAISDVDPQTGLQRFARSSGRAIGESAPAAVALPALTTRVATSTAPTALNATKQLLAQGGQAARATPGAYYATEAAIAGGAGAGGQAAEELFPGNPMAKMIGELAGATTGVGATRVLENTLTKMGKSAFTPEDLKRSASDIYEGIKASDATLAPGATSAMYDDAIKFLDDEGLLMAGKGPRAARVAEDYPKVAQVISSLKAYAGKEIPAKRVLTLRKSITRRLNDSQTPADERMVLRVILRGFDNQTGALSGQIGAANAMYQRAMKADQLDDMMEMARVTSAQYSQSGMENAIRTQFRNLTKRIIRGKELGWSPDEIEQIRQIAEGGSLENAARFIGKFSPRGPVSAMATLAAPFSAAMKVTGDPYVSGAVAGGVGATGKGGELAAAALQKQNVERLMQGVLQGRNIAKPAQDRLRAALTSYLTNKAATAAQE